MREGDHGLYSNARTYLHQKNSKFVSKFFEYLHYINSDYKVNNLIYAITVPDSIKLSKIIYIIGHTHYFCKGQNAKYNYI